MLWAPGTRSTAAAPTALRPDSNHRKSCGNVRASGRPYVQGANTRPIGPILPVPTAREGHLLPAQSLFSGPSQALARLTSGTVSSDAERYNPRSSAVPVAFRRMRLVE